MSNVRKIPQGNIVIFITGFTFCIIGILLFVHSIYINNHCTENTVGLITDVFYETKSTYDVKHPLNYYDENKYFAKVKYLDKEVNIPILKDEFSIGEEVNIKYNPNDTEEFIMDDESSFSGNFLILLGVVLIIIYFKIK